MDRYFIESDNSDEGNPDVRIKHERGDYVLYTDARKVEEELETERIRLAGCGVAAMANTEETTRSQRIGKDSPYWSASYEAVCAAVDREMSMRNERDRLRGELTRVNVQRIETVCKMNQMEHDKNMQIAALTAELAGMREALDRIVVECQDIPDYAPVSIQIGMIAMKALGREAP